MPQKKSFILELPYFLATKAGSINLRILFASCYFALILGCWLPLIGSLAAIGYCLTIWQIIGLKTKKYAIYNSFLLQRVIFYSIYILGLFIFCSKSGEFNAHAWFVAIILLTLLNISDIYFTLKGFTGVAYINGKKN